MKVEHHVDVILAAGGTGGHVYPAQALAGELLGRGLKLALLTDDRGTDYDDALGLIPSHAVRTATPTGKGMVGKFRAGLDIVIGIFQARRWIKSLRPKVVVGFGGYPSVPTVLAALMLRVPVVLHEQNGFAGKVNRVLARKVQVVATSFPNTQGLDRKGRKAHTVRTGNPVREAIIKVRNKAYPPMEAKHLIHLLVVGGSQGATVLSEVVPKAIAALDEHLRKRIRVVQQCRPEDLEDVKAFYRVHKIPAKTDSFFSDMDLQMAEAHLAITRAGASTVTELAVAGRPAILVPYMYAADNHQAYNAQAMADAGGAWVLPQKEFTVEALKDKLESLLENPEALKEAAEKAKAFGIVDATVQLGDLLMPYLIKPRTKE